MHSHFCCRLHCRLRVLLCRARSCSRATPFQRCARARPGRSRRRRSAGRSDRKRRSAGAAAPPTRACRHRGHGARPSSRRRCSICLRRISPTPRSVRKALAKEKADWEAKLAKARRRTASPSRSPIPFWTSTRPATSWPARRQNASSLRDAIAAAKEAVTLAATEAKSKQRDVRRAKDELEHNQDAAAVAALDAGGRRRGTRCRRPPARLWSCAVPSWPTCSSISRCNRCALQLRQAAARPLPAGRRLHAGDARRRCSPTLDARGKAAAARAKQLTDDLSKFLQPQWYQARERLDDARVDARTNRSWRRWRPRCRPRTSPSSWPTTRSASTSRSWTAPSDLRTAWQRRFELANSTSLVVEHGPMGRRDEGRARAAAGRRGHAPRQERRAIQKQLTSIEKKLQDVDAADASLRYWLGKSSESLEQERRLCEKALAELEPARRVFDKLLEDLTGDTLSGTAIRWLAEAPQGRRATSGTTSSPTCRIARSRSAGSSRACSFSSSASTSRGGLAGRSGGGCSTRMGVNASAVGRVSVGRVLSAGAAVHALRAEARRGAAHGVHGARRGGCARRRLRQPEHRQQFHQRADPAGRAAGQGRRPDSAGRPLRQRRAHRRRSTRVKTGDNLDIIVPNSTFLETNVVNWTLSDNNMRTHVQVRRDVRLADRQGDAPGAQGGGQPRPRLRPAGAVRDLRRLRRKRAACSSCTSGSRSAR